MEKLIKAKTPKSLKLNKALVRFFESEQKNYGTEVAMGNLIWLIGTDILHKAGVKNIKTTYYK